MDNHTHTHLGMYVDTEKGKRDATGKGDKKRKKMGKS